MLGFSLQSLKLMLRWKRLCSLAFLAIIGQLVYLLGTPILYKIIFDDGIRDRNWDALVLAISLLAAALVLFGIAGFAQEFSVARLGTNTIGNLRRDVFDKLQSQSPRFLSKFGEGEVANRFSGDLNAIEIAVVRAMPVVITQFLSVLLSIVMLFGIEWRLAILAVLTMPLIGLASSPFNKRAETAMKSQSEDDSKIVGLAQENFTAHLVVLLFRLQRQRIERFLGLVSNLKKSSARAHFYTGLIGRAALIASGFMQLLIIGVGGYLAFNDFMTPGLLIAFVGLLFNVGDAVTHLTIAIPILARGASSMGRINEILEVEPKSAVSSEEGEAVQLKGNFKLEDLSFSYDGNTKALSGVTLAISAGEKVALVGPSGCGKSTVLSLLMRLYEPDSGAIYLDGKRLSDISETCLRNNMSVVLQSPILFDASIAENILLARPEANQEDVVNATRMAAVLETINDLPDKFETRVGEGGGDLSGGQRQRISIARAFLKEANILLLDEATSALDPDSESIVNKSVLGLPSDKTVISVTHRLASIVDFDRIYLFEKGHLRESGNHEDLLNKGGIYSQLWEKQHGFAVDADQAITSVDPQRLHSIPFLSGCEEETLVSFAALFASERFVEKRTIFESGDPGDKFYIIVRGELEVFAPQKEGTEVLLGVLADGDFFGEIALVENRPRTASVRARTDTLCLTLPRQHFIGLMENHPELESNIRQTIIDRLAATDEVMKIRSKQA